jgi:acyl-CoA thioester hydrolase
MDSPERLDADRFNVDIDVRFRDLDAMGHVNNSVYFTYFEEGRKYFFHHIMQSRNIRDFPFIIAHAACDYVRPARLSEPLSLEMWVSEMGDKSFTLTYRLILREDPSVVFARGMTVQVSYDYQNNRTMAIPRDLRAKLDKYMPPRASK